jgi:hypothetical protein
MQDSNLVVAIDRRIVRMIAAMCVLSVAFDLWAQHEGARFIWTNWALPLIVLGNVVVPSPGVFRQHRAVGWVYCGVSFGVLIAVISNLVSHIASRR